MAAVSSNRNPLSHARTFAELCWHAERSGLGAALKMEAERAVDRVADTGDEESALALADLAETYEASDLRSLLLSPGVWAELDRGERMRALEALRSVILDAANEGPGVAATSVEQAIRTGQPIARPLLETWISERGVAPVLAVRADTILEVHWDHRKEALIAGRSIGDFVIEGELGSEVESSLGRELLPIRRAAWRLIARRAEDAPRAAEQTAALRVRFSAVADPTERALVDRLIALRAGAAPLPKSAHKNRMQTESIRMDAQTLAITVEQRDAQWVHRRLTIAPAPEVDQRDAWICTCASSLADCEHAAPAIDAVLALLESKPRPDAFDLFLKAMRMPPWQRALAAFDRAVHRKDASIAAAARMTWRIIPHAAGCELIPCVERVGKKGRFIKPSRVDLNRLDELQGGDLLEGDRRAIALLRDELRLLRELTHGYYGNVRISFATMHRAIAALAGHPRVVVSASQKDAGTPMNVSKHQLTIAATLDAGGSARIELRLEGKPHDEPLDLRALERSAAGGVAVQIDRERGHLQAILLPENASSVLAIASSRDLCFPPEARLELMKRLPAIQERVPVTIDPELEPAHIGGVEDPIVRIEPTAGEAAIRTALLVRPFVGLGAFVPGEGPEQIFHVDPNGDRPVSIERKLDRERANAEGLIASLPALAGAVPLAPFVYELEGDAALKLVRELQDRPAVVVEWPSTRMRIEGTAGTKQLSLSITDGRDWFGVEGGVRVGERELRIAALLEAAAGGRRFVRLEGDAWVEIDRALAEQLARIADVTSTGLGLGLGSGSGEEVRLTAVAPFVLADLGDELAAFEASAQWSTAIGKMVRARELDIEPPEALKAELRPYQREGYRWLARLAEWGLGACLADDMGLGKTVQAIALLTRRAELGPALVVAPTSVGFNWMRELERFAPSLHPIALRDMKAQDRAAALAQLGPGDVAVIGYGLLAREIEELEKLELATFILDEAQAIKNADTDRARAAHRIRASFRIALTGTPVENHVLDLWSIFRAICPGLLGSEPHFRRRFGAAMRPDAKETEGESGRRRSALARLVRPFILRRTKGEVLAELPPKTEIQIDVVLSAAERARYEQARLAAVAHLAGVSVSEEQTEAQKRFSVLAALTRLRQLACDPRLVDEGLRATASSKLTAAVELLRELRDEGHRALVFSQFTSLLALLRSALDESGIKHVYLDGKTPAGDRPRLVDEFQTGSATAFVLSLKAGGSGLNLTAADYVLHLDPWWNPAVEDQATDRAHRIGQTRPVTVYRLVARGTIEETILALHADKRKLFGSILDGTDGAGRLSSEELIALIQESAGAGAETGAGTPASPPKPTRPALPAPSESPRKPTTTTPLRPQGQPSNPAASVTNETSAQQQAKLSEVATLFADFLQTEAQDGRYSASTVAAYTREVQKFLRAAKPSPANATNPTTPDELKLLDEAIAARTGLPRAALRRFREFLEASRT